MKHAYLKLAPLVLFVLVSSVSSQGSQFEYGEPDELRGVKEIFVDTGSDLKTRNAIVKEIRKRLPELRVTDSADEAEVLLVFASVSESRVIGSRSTSAGGVTRSRPTYDTIKRGTGYVARPVSGKLRMLLNYEGANDHLFAKSPETGFARAFVKAYKDANKDLSENPYYRILTGQDKKPY